MLGCWSFFLVMSPETQRDPSALQIHSNFIISRWCYSSWPDMFVPVWPLLYAMLDQVVYLANLTLLFTDSSIIY